ncbi:CLUMA_CG020683, isoform A [Clunio marinus]|uniref:CLUMA_CG020683, isoform A n=1 Tax=Clunio marinus TaxID=568069 RepID=A0A1J1J9N5_9DIPT|nr:CLUMA_CG020683, isoform A [Clunio marinus]
MVKTGRLFRAHGEFCASHPWEVIVALITFTACMFSVDKRSSSSNSDPLLSEPSVKPLCHGWRESCDGFETQYIAADVILMTIVRCSAVLYCYYQFCILHKLGSKYILDEVFTVKQKNHSRKQKRNTFHQTVLEKL